jgi:hypothetical protein
LRFKSNLYCYNEFVAREFFDRGGFNVSVYSSDRQDVLWNNQTGYNILAPSRLAPPPPAPPPTPLPPPPKPPLPMAPTTPCRSDDCIATRNRFDISSSEGNTAVHFGRNAFEHDGVGSFGVIKHSPRLISFVNATKKSLSVEAWIKPDVDGEEIARLQTIAMLGHMGWGLQLMCPLGAGIGCCGDHLIRSVGFFMPGAGGGVGAVHVDSP